MAYPIEKKLVIAVASSALFDLSESDSIFRANGIEKYKEYQKKNLDNPFEKGVAFPFVSRLLRLNTSFPEEPQFIFTESPFEFLRLPLIKTLFPIVSEAVKENFGI